MSTSARHTFGTFQLDAGSRTLSRSGQTVALAPKTFDLLLLLIESQGRVLTKAELMAALWHEAFVEEANLSFQISTLRKALGDEGARWIETAPKVGYRFSGPLEAAPTVTASPAPATVEFNRRLFWLIPAAAAVAATAVAIWWEGGRQATTPPVEPIPLTSYEGIEDEPSFSPDSSQVAFAWNGERQDNFDIYVKAVGSGTPSRLTSDSGRDCMPAWSPDGRRIAFQRVGQGIYLIPPTGGAESQLISLASLCAQLSWSPDGNHLSFSKPAVDREPAGIFLVAVDNRTVRRLTRARDSVAAVDLRVPASNVHRASAFSPDGRSLAFVEGTDPGDPNACDIMVQPLSGDAQPSGPARLIGHQPDLVTSLSWTGDGLALIFPLRATDTKRL